jgi:hypothetical protein
MYPFELAFIVRHQRERACDAMSVSSGPIGCSHAFELARTDALAMESSDVISMRVMGARKFSMSCIPLEDGEL